MSSAGGDVNMMTERFPRPLLYVIKERNEPFPDNRQRESADGKLVCDGFLLPANVR